jgi:hypothetical protein
VSQPGSIAMLFQEVGQQGAETAKVTRKDCSVLQQVSRQLFTHATGDMWCQPSELCKEGM